ncbi:MAG: hypothetical protein WAT78_07145 [Rhizobiaceae bacterium]
MARTRHAGKPAQTSQAKTSQAKTSPAKSSRAKTLAAGDRAGAWTDEQMAVLAFAIRFAISRRKGYAECPRRACRSEGACRAAGSRPEHVICDARIFREDVDAGVAHMCFTSALWTRLMQGPII